MQHSSVVRKRRQLRVHPLMYQEGVPALSAHQELVTGRDIYLIDRTHTLDDHLYTHHPRRGPQAGSHPAPFSPEGGQAHFRQESRG